MGIGIEERKKQPVGKLSILYNNLSDFKKIVYFSILIPFLISIIVGGISYLILEQYHIFRDEKNIAQAIKIEFDSMEPELNTYISQWGDATPFLNPGFEPNLNVSIGNNFIPTISIYPDSGIYFLYGKDIYKLDP